MQVRKEKRRGVGGGGARVGAGPGVWRRMEGVAVAVGDGVEYGLGLRVADMVMSGVCFEMGMDFEDFVDCEDLVDGVGLMEITGSGGCFETDGVGVSFDIRVGLGEVLDAVGFGGLVDMAAG